MADYVALVATAKRLIDANGAASTLKRVVDNPTDPATPWVVGAPTETPHAVRAVRVDPKAKDTDQRTAFLVAAIGLPFTPEKGDILDFAGVEKWTIETAVPLNPGGVTILYEMVGTQWPAPLQS